MYPSFSPAFPSPELPREIQDTERDHGYLELAALRFCASARIGVPGTTQRRPKNRRAYSTSHVVFYRFYAAEPPHLAIQSAAVPVFSSSVPLLATFILAAILYLQPLEPLLTSSLTGN